MGIISSIVIALFACFLLWAMIKLCKFADSNDWSIALKIVLYISCGLSGLLVAGTAILMIYTIIDIVSLLGWGLVLAEALAVSMAVVVVCGIVAVITKIVKK